MVTTPPPVPGVQAPPRPPPIAPPPAGPKRKKKKFSVTPWTGAGEGEKIIIYGPSGVGKTTLGAMAPSPVFLGLDDGGRKVRNPITGQPIQHIDGLETFDDVRDALSQKDLFEPGQSAEIDTLTMLETFGSEWTVQNILHEKGHKVTRLVEYGYGKGYEHLYDTMRLVVQEFDALVRRGVNVILLCQQCPTVKANPAGANYYEDGPKLYAPGPDSKQSFSIRLFFQEWADHVLRVDYPDMVIGKDRKATGSSTRRAIWTMPEPHAFAKTRTLKDPVVSFEHVQDDSIWRLIFPDHYTSK